MKYVFAAERKLVFPVAAGGIKRLVEFSDRNSQGASVFQTDDANIAKAITNTSLARRGVISVVSCPPEEEDKAQSPVVPKSEIANKPSNRLRRKANKADLKEQEPDKSPKTAIQNEKVREYANFTLAKEAISKEFGIDKNIIKNPIVLARIAKDNGILIKYQDA